MAQLAGFELEARHANWAGTEFTAESPSHVSVYRLKIADPGPSTCKWAIPGHITPK